MTECYSCSRNICLFFLVANIIVNIFKRQIRTLLKLNINIPSLLDRFLSTNQKNFRLYP